MAAALLAVVTAVWSFFKKYWKPLAQMVGSFFVGRKSVETANLKQDMRDEQKMEKASASAPSDITSLAETLKKGEF